MARNTVLKALIVDDEPNARENLALMLGEFCPEIDVVGMASGVAEAERDIKEKEPDVVFLDIRMPSGAEGFDLLKRVKEHRFFVVFVTAFKDYALEALNANALHYVLKPIDEEDLRQAVEKLLERAQEVSSSPQKFGSYQEALHKALDEIAPKKFRISIPHSRGIKLLNVDDIEYLEADGNCSMLHLRDGSRFLDTRTLKTYESELPKNLFVRVHRSYIVNFGRADELLRENGTWLQLKNGKRIPVSRKRLSYLVDLITSV